MKHAEGTGTTSRKNGESQYELKTFSPFFETLYMKLFRLICTALALSFFANQIQASSTVVTGNDIQGYSDITGNEIQDIQARLDLTGQEFPAYAFDDFGQDGQL